MKNNLEKVLEINPINNKKYIEAVSFRDWQTCDLICDEHSVLVSRIKQLEQELQKTREQLNLANEIILDLMQQHIGWNDNPVNAWNYTALSADEKADDYWSKYLKDKQGEG